EAGHEADAPPLERGAHGRVEGHVRAGDVVPSGLEQAGERAHPCPGDGDEVDVHRGRSIRQAVPARPPYRGDTRGACVPLSCVVFRWVPTSVLSVSPKSVSASTCSSSWPVQCDWCIAHRGTNTRSPGSTSKLPRLTSTRPRPERT